MGPPARTASALLARRSRPEERRMGDVRRAEPVGGGGLAIDTNADAVPDVVELGRRD